MHACVRVSEGYKGYTAMIKETYRDPWPRWFVVIGLSTSVMLVLECELSSTRHPLYRCRQKYLLPLGSVIAWSKSTDLLLCCWH